jgi:hypothetical protein
MSDERPNASDRRYDVDLRQCIYKDCRGELFELMYDETINWITIIYKCAQCARDFTVKIEV